jgi:hypothetical protein
MVCIYVMYVVKLLRCIKIIFKILIGFENIFNNVSIERGKFFFPDEGPQVRSVKCSALSHIKSADPVKKGTLSACFPLWGKHADLLPILVRPFSPEGKRTDFFYFQFFFWSA